MGSQRYETVDLTLDNEPSIIKPPPPRQRRQRVETLSPPPKKFAKPWWHRLPYFVPVAAIEYDTETELGTDPRSGESVYVDYVQQFSSEGGAKSASKPTEKRKERLSRQQATKQSQRLSGMSESGEWTTNARGKAVFKTQDGKEYGGMKAYKMHAKLLLQQTERLSATSLNP